MEALLDPRTVRMPEFAEGTWLGADPPLSKAGLHGKTVLIDFWDYTCVNCLRTLPYLRAWHERYAAHGLVIVGVHSPEFAFARATNQIAEAVERLGIAYPVLLDNDYQTWDRYANRAWPTKYLIDAEGYIRFRHQGEGAYQRTEAAIQAALRLADPHLSLPDLLNVLRPKDAEGAVCYPTPPELYAGDMRSALGNAEGSSRLPAVYQMPAQRSPNAFYISGIWRTTAEALAFAGQEGGDLLLPYRALGVNAVLSPSADPVEVMLGLRQSDQPPIVEVRQDGRHLTPDNAGADIEYDDGGLSYVQVDGARMYHLVENPGFEQHELTLTFRAAGLALYSFTFNSCVKPGR